MKYQTHTLFGAALASLVLWISGIALMPMVIILGAFGALIPDLDHQKSKGSNLNPAMKIVSILLIGIVTVFNLIFNALAKILNSITPLNIRPLGGVHRGPVTHSLLAVALVAGLTYPMTLFVSVWWWVGLWVGVLSHVLIDSVNPSGTPLLWPINQNRVRIIPKQIAPTTGSLGEGVVTIMVVVLLIVSMTGAFQTNGGFSADDWKMLIPQDSIDRITAEQEARNVGSKESTAPAEPGVFDFILDAFRAAY